MLEVSLSLPVSVVHKKIKACDRFQLYKHILYAAREKNIACDSNHTLEENSVRLTPHATQICACGLPHARVKSYDQACWIPRPDMFIFKSRTPEVKKGLSCPPRKLYGTLRKCDHDIK